MAFKLLIWWYGVGFFFSPPRWKKGEACHGGNEHTDEKLENSDYGNTTDEEEEEDGDPKTRNLKPSNKGWVAFHLTVYSPQCIYEYFICTSLR